MKTDEEVLERTTSLARAVIRVGDGRGFVVERRRQRFVLTAAHCLPKLPPAHPMSHTKERTYQALLGPLGAEPTVWAECLFADPVADIAILSGPDNQALFDQAEAYEEFLDDKVPLAIGDAPKQWRKQVVLPGGGAFSSFAETMPGLRLGPLIIARRPVDRMPRGASRASVGGG